MNAVVYSLFNKPQFYKSMLHNIAEIWIYLRSGIRKTSMHIAIEIRLNTLRTGSFKLFKRPFPGFLTILTI